MGAERGMAIGASDGNPACLLPFLDGWITPPVLLTRARRERCRLIPRAMAHVYKGPIFHERYTGSGWWVGLMSAVTEARLVGHFIRDTTFFRAKPYISNNVSVDLTRSIYNVSVDLIRSSSIG